MLPEGGETQRTKLKVQSSKLKGRAKRPTANSLARVEQ